MNDELLILITTPPDREQEVSELWFENELVAELSTDGGPPTIELYPRRDGKPWRFSFEEFLDGIEKMKARLLGTAP